MLEGLLGSFIDKEQVVKDYISDAIERVAKEFKLEHNEISFMIRPVDEEFAFRVYAVKLVNSQPKEILKEVTIKDIVAPPEDE